MTNKTTMPEPVLTRRVFHPSTGEIEQHLITTTQAEAYADAKVREALDRLQGLSNGAYCRYIDTLYRDECLGWEAKVKDGRFGEREFNAYKKAHEFLGQHRAFAEAIITIRALIPTTK